MAGVQGVSFTSPYAAEEADIERRRRMAELLQAKGAEGLGATEMVGGWAIPKSPWEGLGKASQQVLGAYQQGKLKEESKALRDRAQAEAMQWYGSQPQARPESVAGFPGEPEMATGATKQPTQQEQMAWLMRGTNNPASAPIAQMMLAQQLKMNDPYSLREGEKRYGPGNVVLAQNDKPRNLHFGNTGGAIQGFDQTSGAPVGPATPTTMSPDAAARLQQQQYEWANLSPAQRAHLTNESIRTGVSVQELMFNTGQQPAGGAPLPAPGPMPQSPQPQFPPAAPAPAPRRTSGDPLPVRFTPQEESANAADVRSPEARAELEKELSRKDLSPRARAILQAELSGFGAQPSPVPAPQPQPARPAVDSNRPIIEQVTPKERQALLVAKPQAEAAATTTIQNIDRLSKMATELHDHEGLSGVTGKVNQYSIGDVMPSTRAARGLQDSLVNQVGVQALQAMREASKTGGAIGAVTEKEWPILQQSIAALSAAQGTPDYQKALVNLKTQIGESAKRVQQAYEQTYGPLKVEKLPHTTQNRSVEGKIKPFGDAAQEKRYQEWKAKNSG